MKKSILQKSLASQQASTLFYQPQTPIVLPLHFHYEYELILFTQGNGIEFIGDTSQTYQSGDLTLIGSQVPHLHFSDINKGIGICDLIQFSPSLFPSDIEKCNELQNIGKLLNRSSFGIKFHSKPLIRRVAELMKELNSQHGVNRFCILLNILELLSRATDTSYISQFTTHLPNSSFHSDLKDQVSQYLQTHFKEKIYLRQIAEYIGLSSASLCRTFRQKTGKTIFSYLNEIRISYVCKALLQTDKEISQLAYEAGFNNLSHFNKQFKLITGKTPSAYKEFLWSNDTM